MEIFAIALFHGLVAYITSRTVPTGVKHILGFWVNVAIAGAMGAAFFAPVDITAVLIGYYKGHVDGPWSRTFGASYSEPRSSANAPDKIPLPAPPPAPEPKALPQTESASTSSDWSPMWIFVAIFAAVLLVALATRAPEPPRPPPRTYRPPAPSQPARAVAPAPAAKPLPKGDLSRCRELATNEAIIKCVEDASK